MLSVEGVSAGYGGSVVLHSVSLQVNEGEAVVLLGPNGHGKTTLLRVISGLVRPLEGSVRFDDVELTDLRPDEIVAAGVVHIPQGDLPFPLMSVTENLLMGAYPSQVWRERQGRLDQVLELFPGLASRRNQLARSLSGGERRMLALGRGLMGKARILLIDEPSLGLAPGLAEQVYSRIADIRKTGISILLVDESANHVEGFAQRVYVMGAGMIVREGTAEGLLRDEALLAAYLG